MRTVECSRNDRWTRCLPAGNSTQTSGDVRECEEEGFAIRRCLLQRVGERTKSRVDVETSLLRPHSPRCESGVSYRRTCGGGTEGADRFAVRGVALVDVEGSSVASDAENVATDGADYLPLDLARTLW